MGSKPQPEPAGAPAPAPEPAPEAVQATDAVIHDVAIPKESLIPSELVPQLEGWEIRFNERTQMRVRSIDIDPLIRARANQLIAFMRTRARLADARVKLPVGPMHTWPNGMSPESLNDLRVAVRVLLQESGEAVASHDPAPGVWLVSPIVGSGTTKPRFTIGAPKPQG